MAVVVLPPVKFPTSNGQSPTAPSGDLSKLLQPSPKSHTDVNLFLLVLGCNLYFQTISTFYEV